VIKPYVLGFICGPYFDYLLKVSGISPQRVDHERCFNQHNVVFMAVLKKFLVDYMLARGYNTLNVVIVGAGKVGTMLAQEIQKAAGVGVTGSGIPG